MSHLHSILNPQAGRNQGVMLSVDTESIDHMSSSPDDDISPTSDDEIDELDGESDEEEDYDEPSPPVLQPVAAQPVVDRPQERFVELSKPERPVNRVPTRSEEKKPEKPPVPRRRLERHDRKIDLGLHDHKSHADCPDTLACLPDTNGRPQHTLPVILRCAILGSPRKRLTIREIYATMEAKYPYYKTAGQTWKQSVRHHLSLNRLFERQPRPVTDPGFGSYWTVNLAAPPGTKRPRKRGRPNKDTSEASSSKKASLPKAQPIPPPPPPQNQLPAPTKYQFQPQTHPPPPPPPLPQPQVNSLSPRSSGQHQPPNQPMPQPQPRALQQQQSQQPPKSQAQPQPQSRQFQQHNQSQHQSHFQSQPRTQHHSVPQYHPQPQRPPEMQHRQSSHHRKPSPLTPASGRESTYPPSSKDSETDDGGLMNHEEDNAPFATVSEDEYESEEDMIRPYDHRQSLSGPATFVPTRPSPIFSLPPFSALEQNREDVVEHMRQEIATLRRTSAEAVSTSIRLSEQLANANLEVSRSREAVRDLEDMLQDEASKRKDAERQKEMEAERRRAAEHALNNLALRSPPRSRPT